MSLWRSMSSTAHRVDKFYLPTPVIGNTYSNDHYFQSVLRRCAPRVASSERFAADLTRLGERCGSKGDLAVLGAKAEAQPPTLNHYGPFGERVDEIHVSHAWERLKDVSAQEGIVAEGYDRAAWGDSARFAQFSKMYLFYPATAVFSCPLAMTDGAARVLELYGGDFGKPLFAHLTVRTCASAAFANLRKFTPTTSRHATRPSSGRAAST